MAKAGATMRDVAGLAGVSVKTVSNVVNEYPHISAHTRARVEQAIDKLNYQVNLSAQGLRRGRTGVVGLVVPDLRLPYFGELAQRVVAEAEKYGLSVMVEVTGGTRSRELEVLQSSSRSLTDGLIFQPVALRQSDSEALNVDYPLVVLGERIFGAPTDHATMANAEAAYAATKLLHAGGARRIAVLGYKGSDEVGSSTLRVDGYRRALEELGIVEDPELILRTGEWSRLEGARATERALEAGLQFDAIFGLNDTLTLGALHVLHLAGLEVPERVQVIGFDNIEEAAYSSPPLTTVDPQVGRIVETAVKMLTEQIEQRGHRRRRLVVEGFEICQRASTKAS